MASGHSTVSCIHIVTRRLLQKGMEFGVKMPGGVKPEEFDYFHEMIIHHEISRLGTPGYIDGLGGGYLISAPCVMNFGSEPMKRTIGK